MRPSLELDEKDRQLIDLLREDARKPSAALARALGVARTTIVERLKRLQKCGIIDGYTVRLSENVRRRQLRVHALLSVDAKKGDAVMQALRRITHVRAVFAISGVYDCMALIEAESTVEVDSVLDAIGAIPGVAKTQSWVVLSVKFDRH